MPVQRKIFRIEQTTPVNVTAGMLDGAGISPADRQEILAELKALHDLVERRSADIRARTSRPADADELRQLKSDTDAIHLALNRTKQEIAALHVNAFGPPPARMTRELDAVVESAERATQQILGAAEDIEDAANTLSASLKREQEQVARARHPGQRAAHLRSLQFPGPHRPAHRQGADDAEIRRGAHRAHDRDLGRHRRLQDLCRGGRRRARSRRACCTARSSTATTVTCRRTTSTPCSPPV